MVAAGESLRTEAQFQTGPSIRGVVKEIGGGPAF